MKNITNKQTGATEQNFDLSLSSFCLNIQKLHKIPDYYQLVNMELQIVWLIDPVSFSRTNGTDQLYGLRSQL